MYPRKRPRKRHLLVAPALLAVGALVAGCGGKSGGGTSTEAAGAQQILGAGFLVVAPAEWQVRRAGNTVTAHPAAGPALASATVIALRQRYRPALFARTARELDRVTDALAVRLDGKVIARRTLLVAGIRSRQYDVAYTREGAGIVDRVTYVLRGKAEYYLLCRWAAADGESNACGLLTDGFRIR